MSQTVAARFRSENAVVPRKIFLVYSPDMKLTAHSPDHESNLRDVERYSMLTQWYLRNTHWSDNQWH